ncbi:MAG: type II toxin-antitoxin system PemK/MazF family toxin [Candidatus Micrarchaeota archaeon]
MKPRRNEIYFSPFPFSDSSEEKTRPVLVISNNHYNSNEPDVIVCGMTSNIGNPYALPIHKADLEHGILYEDSYARADMVGRIAQNKLHYRIGKVREEFCARLIARIMKLIG